MNKNKLGAMAIFVVVILAMLAGMCALIWQGMLLVPPNAARLWALLVTSALPFVAWGAWWFGHTEARGRLAGFDKAIDKTFAGLSRASGLSQRHTKISKPTESPVVVLPNVEILQRRLPPGDNVVEL